MFDRRCARAGENISKAIGSVKGLYVEKDEFVGFNGLMDGVYSSIGFGHVGKHLLGTGIVDFYELRPSSTAKTSSIDGQYLRFTRADEKPIVTSELSSDFALLWRDIATPAERALKISGNEYSIVERASGHRIASTVFFVSSMHRKICGHPGGRHYAVTDFVERVIRPSNDAPPTR